MAAELGPTLTGWPFFVGMRNEGDVRTDQQKDAAPI